MSFFAKIEPFDPWKSYRKKMLEFIQTMVVKIITISTAVLLFFGIGNGVKTEDIITHAKRESAVAEEINLSLFKKNKTVGIEGAETFNDDTIPTITVEEKDLFLGEKFNNKNTGKMETLQEKTFPPIADTQRDNVAPKTISSTKKLINGTVLNQKAREATVNIFCLSKSGGFFKPISGSGVIIDGRGVILTNAHVAQYFLLKDYLVSDYVDCVVRNNSPAKLAYRAEILFLPSTWVENNAENIVTSNPTGTGESDYALLRITESARKGVLLPSSFPFLSPSLEDGKVFLSAPVLIASYPAGFVGGVATAKNLWLTSTISKIKELYTFGDVPSRDVDLFEIFGTLSAQEGSSGGGVVDFEDGELLGIVVTRTAGDTTGERNLRILSTDYINKNLREHTGKGIREFLLENLEERARYFASTTAPRLKQILFDVLDG